MSVKEVMVYLIVFVCILIIGKIETVLKRKWRAWAARKRRQHPHIASFLSILRRIGRFLVRLGYILVVIFICAAIFYILGPLILMAAVLIIGLYLAHCLKDRAFPGPSKYDLAAKQAMDERMAAWNQAAEQAQMQRDAYRQEAERLDNEAHRLEYYARKNGSRNDAARAQQLRHQAAEARKKSY